MLKDKHPINRTSSHTETHKAVPNAASPEVPFTPFPSPYTFPQIIDADHFTINTLARRIRSPSSTPSDLKPLILEATWRLIRHDLSEDLVMRPAFASYLGSTGAEMAEHDRNDHARGRDVLLRLINATPELDVDDPDTMAHALKVLGGLFDELGEHMAIESGEHIPRFCAVIDERTSHRLAEEYALTLCMTPFVTKMADPEDSNSRKAAPQRTLNHTPVFPSGVKEYVNSNLTALRKIYAEVLEDAKHDNGKRIRDEISKEMERLKVGKWLGYNERKALREGKGGGLGRL